MRIGTVLIASDTSATVLIEDLGIRMKCQIIKGIAVKVNDRALVEFTIGDSKGVIIGVM